jgi:hypothetical protein
MAAALFGLEHQRDEIDSKMAEVQRQLDGRVVGRHGVLLA